jgi:hypothetical protein
MERLVNDLLTLSALESDQNPLDEVPFAIGPLLQTLGNDAKALSGGQHTVAVEVGDAATVTGSREELASAFGNLLSNAIRYTPAGGTITLRWDVDEEGIGIFAVSDTGIGIAPEHVPRLMERFYRVDRSRSRATGGTGLGLAIVKHVLLRHDASMTVTSEPGKGSTFSVRLPPSASCEGWTATLRARRQPKPLWRPTRPRRPVSETLPPNGPESEAICRQAHRAKGAQQSIAIILASGLGRRMASGKNKVFLTLGRRPIIFYAIAAFEKRPESRFDRGYRARRRNRRFPEHRSQVPDSKKVKAVIHGGRARQDSAFNALEYLNTEHGHVDESGCRLSQWRQSVCHGGRNMSFHRGGQKARIVCRCPPLQRYDQGSR